MTRDPSSRWQPLICVNDTRQTLGIVRMERLIHMLVREDVSDGAVEEEQS